MSWEDAETFLLVVEVGSFTAAAERLVLPISSVSRRVARLEGRLGIQLLQRTTRSLHLTPAGELYAREMSELLGRRSRLEAHLSGLASEPSGSLRVTCPSRFSDTAGPLFSGFLHRYPKVSLQLIEEDRVADLIGEGVDAALRGAATGEPGLVSTCLMELSFKLFASPHFLAACPPITRLGDLADVPCVMRLASASEPWVLRREGLEETVKVSGRFSSRNLHARQNAVLWGLGVGLLPEMYCLPRLEAGELVPVLPDYQGDGSALWLVYAEARHLSSALRAFVDYVVAFPWFDTVVASQLGPDGPELCREHMRTESL